jgi:aryl-alcohol dehydrogenase-like predicted oxidoreductase
MQYRELGPEKLRVSAIGLGGRRLSDIYTDTRDDDSKARAVLDRAIELGVTLIDTANSYADGANEEMFGRLLRGRRDRVVLATKFGIVKHADGSRGVNGRPDYAIACCEESLGRLRTDVIDLYYLHRVDPAVPIEDTVGAMVRLREQGKIRHVGLSEAGPEILRRAAAVHPVAALQSDYSLWVRGHEAEVLPACAALGIGFIAYYPLGKGFLAGAIRAIDSLGPEDGRRRDSRFEDDNIGSHLERLTALKRIADAKGCTVGQLALAWILAHGPGFVAIPGTSRVAHLEANAAAADIALSGDDMARIDAVFPREAASAAS